MTTYVIRNGDVLKAARSFNLINCFAHGANCWSVMASGIAKYVAQDFVDIRQADTLDERSPDQRLGNMSYAYDTQTGVWGFNLYTQFYPGPNARMPSVISSVQYMFEQVHEIVEAEDSEVVYVGFPAIGCGIGGLDLTKVVIQIHKLAESLFEDTRRQVVPVFYILEAERFKEDLFELDASDEDILVLDSEEEVLDAEAS